MPQYRRARIPGSTIFITCVTHPRKPLFQDPHNIQLLRNTQTQTQQEKPFTITAAVILPERLHFLWQLPDQDCNYSARVGQMKVQGYFILNFSFLCIDEDSRFQPSRI